VTAEFTVPPALETGFGGSTFLVLLRDRPANAGLPAKPGLQRPDGSLGHGGRGVLLIPAAEQEEKKS
jgi:hypothetical protein